MKPAKKVKIEQVIEEPNNSSDQMTIEKAMYIGKTEGMALGIITLFLITTLTVTSSLATQPYSLVAVTE